MISKGVIKYIRSLELKKFRNEHRVFLAEGDKLVAGMLGSFACEMIVATPSWMANQGDIPVRELIEADEEDIRRASLLKNPQHVLAVFECPDYALSEADPSAGLILALDGVQDPGNVGTIIRLAAWFGIEHVVCSPDTADAFAPKTVQATMGALAHVKVHYTPLESYLKGLEAPLYGTFMDGENIYAGELSPTGVIVMGNEGSGIREETASLITQRLTIPGYTKGSAASESLNVAIATAIVCSEFRRREEGAALPLVPR
ncbi:MAG: RNA methyltransferase [Tannerellaceae bacterium]|jgi:TrmH family RNA methyltransferase|nr:RNA methyltransferase [Tannerellaceae bacterium]